MLYSFHPRTWRWLFPDVVTVGGGGVDGCISGDGGVWEVMKAPETQFGWMYIVVIINRGADYISPECR